MRRNLPINARPVTVVAILAMGAGLSSGAFAASQDCVALVSGAPLALERFADGVVAFVPAETSAGSTEIEVVYYRPDDRCRPLVIDDYGIEGGDPRLETSFIYPVQGKPNLFAIVSWPMDHAGLEMRGRYYSVVAYRQSGAGLELNAFVAENTEISSGIVGTAEGIEHAFEGTTEEGLIALMGSLGKWSWQAACNPSGNQHELTACAFVAQIEAGEELQEVGQLFADAFDDPVVQADRLARFEHEHSVWETQLERDLDALFPLSPLDDPTIVYGSSYAMQHAYARAFLVRQRVDFLRAFWLPYGARSEDSMQR